MTFICNQTFNNSIIGAQSLEDGKVKSVIHSFVWSYLAQLPCLPAPGMRKFYRHNIQ